MKSPVTPARTSSPKTVGQKRTLLLARLQQGLQADVQDYRRLQEVLAAQFDAIVHHRSALLEEIAAQVVQLVDALEARRQERVQIVTTLMGRGNQASMEALMPLLPQPYDQAVPPLWQELELLVKDCKERNTRNCDLLMAQNEIMQRVLNGEADTYAPA